MFISRVSLPRRTFLRGVGAALALPLLDAMVPALAALADTPASPRPRLGFIYMPNGVAKNSSGIDYWTPRGEGTGFEHVADPGAAGAVSRPDGGRQRPGSQPGRGRQRRRERRSHPRHELVADRRASQAHRGRRRPQRRLRRSDRRGGPRQGDGAAVARARHRSQFPRRAMREQLQLRLPEHAGVDVADDAAADREQSAGGVRAAVRRRRHRGAARPRRRARTRASSIRCSRTSTACSGGSGPGDRTAADGIRRCRARGRAANPDRRTERGDRAADARSAEGRAGTVRRAREADVRACSGWRSAPTSRAWSPSCSDAS